MLSAPTSLFQLLAHPYIIVQGDPLDTSVLLWTRALPSFSASAALDQSLPISGVPVNSGDAFTSYEVDYTVKLEATGLQPDTTYFFQFHDCLNPQSLSPIGRTRTLPMPNTAAQKIYESLGNGTAIGRETMGRELATIHDYRQRLNQYRTDVSLVMAHQSAPWITGMSIILESTLIFTAPFSQDDHEVADQAWKAGTANSNDSSSGCSFSPSEACFTDRKMAAVRAYHEWMPIRQVDPNNRLRIWRNFQIGKLIDLTMLDTRQYSRDITDLYYNTG
ncbi:hypothetical protein ONZ45_g2760 [Pleurotus djamor]|nr:hypothetical protein ONZ45_g2760 [Pleurotus djamor]